MAITIDWPTLTFSVPQADLTLISGTLYEMDTETDFRQAVNAIMAGEEGIVFEDSLTHNTQVTVAGTTFARTIEMINGYSLQFTPDTQFSVRFVGSNNNLFDVENAILVQNQVQVIPANSGGLISPGLSDIFEQMMAGNVDINPTNTLITVFKKGSTTDVLATFSVSGDGRQRRRVT